MAEQIWVRPKRGMVVPDPDMGDRFPHDGRETLLTDYVQRRINEGGLIKMDAPPPAPAAAPAPVHHSAAVTADAAKKPVR